MVRVFVLLILAFLPNAALACFSCCDTYDLADPGAWGLKEPMVYKYVLGRVSQIDRASADTHDNRVLVTIRVLKDYRYPTGEEVIQALANGSKTCGAQIQLGQYGKFGIDDRGGVPTLVSAHHSL